MDQLPLNARLLVTVLFIGQVCGSPTYYWSQPDCYQQNSDYPYSYDSYQRPSYQETLQAMVEETLRAICEIVQVTAKATKEELAAIARMIYKSAENNKECDTSLNSQDDYGPPSQSAELPYRPMDSEYTNINEPQNGNPEEIDISLTTTENNSGLSTDEPLAQNNVDISNTSTGTMSNNTSADIYSSKPVQENNSTTLSSSAEMNKTDKKIEDGISTVPTVSTDNEPSSLPLKVKLANLTFTTTTGEYVTNGTTESSSTANPGTISGDPMAIGSRKSKL